MPEQRLTLTLTLLCAMLAMAMVFIFKTWADTTFLAISGTRYLPHLLAAQATLMAALSLVYSRLIRHVRALVLDLTLISLCVALGAVALLIVGNQSSGPFVSALLMLSFPAIANLSLWNSLQNIVRGRAIREFLPKLGAAATAGAALGSLGAAQLSTSIGVDALVITGTLVSILLLVLRLGLNPYLAEPAVDSHQRAGVNTREDRAGRRLILFLVFSTLFETLVAGLIDYGFKRELSLHFDMSQLALTLALFYAATNASMFVVQMFGIGRLFSTQPLGNIAIVTPGVIMFASVAWVIFPGIWVAAATRYLDAIFRFSIARPTLEIGLSPLSPFSRKRWKVMLRGGIAQLGTVVAGLLLIPGAALLDHYPYALGLILSTTALCWLLLQFRMARHYVTVLANALGKKQFGTFDSAPEWRPDQASISQIVNMLGSTDQASREFAQNLLADLNPQCRQLTPFLVNSPASIRTTLYHLLQHRKPTRHDLKLIREAIAAEQPHDEVVFVAALDLLAAYGDDSEQVRAAALLKNNSLHDMSLLQLAAASYLVRTRYPVSMAWNATDLACRLLYLDGRRCGLLLAELSRRAELDEQAVLECLAAPEQTASEGSETELALALAHLATPAALGILTRLFHSNATRDDLLFPILAPAALAQFIKRLDLSHTDADTRRRLAYALRFNDSIVADKQCKLLLDDPSGTVRLAAIRCLLYKQSRDKIQLARHELDTVIERYMDRLECFINARLPVHQQHHELFDMELEQLTHETLGELCSLLALYGDAAGLLAAERGLKASDQSLKRKSLDALQEVVRGSSRKRFLKLLEHYISPRAPSASARERARNNPWLARCSNHALEPLEPRIKALRQTALFGDIEGEKLVELARLATVQQYDSQAMILRKGEPADTLYIVLEGTVAIDTGNSEKRIIGYSQAFGELGVFDGKPRSADVIADQQCALMKIARDDFMKLMDQYPEVGLGVLRVMAGWLRNG